MSSSDRTCLVTFVIALEIKFPVDEFQEKIEPPLECRIATLSLPSTLPKDLFFLFLSLFFFLFFFFFLLLFFVVFWISGFIKTLRILKL